MAAVDVLEALAVESDIRALFRKTASGSSPGRELAERCLASGVVAADHHTVTCDRDALSTIFTAALQHGLGSFIVDYVEEVCADEYLTSNDPREAELLDGRLAKEWCGETLQRIQGQQLPGLLQQAAISASESVQQSVCGLISHVNAVKNVLDALNSPAVREGNQRVVVTSELELARQLQQALLVLQWLQQTGLLPASAGRHVSEREWAAAVRAREAGAKARLSGGQTFLADLLAQLQGSCRCSAIAYPPPSPVAFVQQVLLAGGSDEECWSSKLRLLVYYCSDGGFRTRDGDAVDAAFGLLPKAHDTLVPEARALYALDAALVADADGRDALHSACGLLPGAVHPGLPPKVLEVLVALDRSLDAATVADAWLDACKVAGVSVSRDQASMVLGSVLAAGLLSHAFLMMRRLGEGLAEADRAEGEAQLVQQLAEWARQHQRTHQLLELPFSESEELHLRRWLQQQAAHAPGSAGPSWPAASHQLLSFFLLRSRLTEALLADGGRSAGGDSAAGPAKQDYLSRMRQELLRGVRRQVPEAVRALCAERAGSAVMRTDAPSIQPSRSCSLLDCMDMRLASDPQLAPGPLLHSRLLWPPGVRRSAPSQPPQQLPSAHKLPAPASNAAAPPPQQPPPTRRSANPQPSLDPLPSPALFPPPREQSVAPPVAASPGDGSRGRMYPPLSSIGSMSSAAVGEDAARAPAPPGQPVDSNSPSVTVDTDRPPAAEASIDEILGTHRVMLHGFTTRLLYPAHHRNDACRA